MAHQRPGVRRAQRPRPGSLGRGGRLRRASARRTRASRRGRTTRRSSCSRSSGHAAAIRERTLRSTTPRPSACRPTTSACTLDLAAARAEVAWLEQRPAHRRRSDRARCSRRALARGDTGAAASACSFWRRLAGLEVDTELDAAGAHALALAGEWETRPRRVGALTCFPYEAALALIETNDEESLRQALDDAPGARGAPRLAARDATAARARRARRHARPAEGDARERGRADAARERGARRWSPPATATPRSPSSSSSPAARSTTTSRRSCASSMPARASRPSPRAAARPAPRPVARRRKHGNSTDADRGSRGVPFVMVNSRTTGEE